MASSGGYGGSQFNLAAQGHRQPGSAFKTFALTDAIRRGVDPDSTYYTSQPLDLDDDEYGHWDVSTYSDSYAGSVNLHQATLASDNTVFAQLALDLGPDSVADTAKDMGIETKLDGLPAETLGGLRLGVSPLEITNAYATLASGGVHNEPIAIRKVKFNDGEVDEIGEPDRNRVFEDGVAYEVTEILEDNVDAGTGTSAGTGCGDEAGKTGTTDDFNDAMFIGYTPISPTGVWVGYPDALQSMYSVHGVSVAGGTFPAMIWHDFMEVALDGRCETFPEPEQPGRVHRLQRRVHLRLRLELVVRQQRQRLLRGRVRMLLLLRRLLRDRGHLGQRRWRLRARRRPETRAEARAEAVALAGPRSPGAARAGRAARAGYPAAASLRSPRRLSPPRAVGSGPR